jgi:hypothetical protein
VKYKHFTNRLRTGAKKYHRFWERSRPAVAGAYRAAGRPSRLDFWQLEKKERNDNWRSVVGLPILHARHCNAALKIPRNSTHEELFVFNCDRVWPRPTGVFGGQRSTGANGVWNDDL